MTYLHIGKNVIDQMRRPLRHASPGAAQAEPAALAREGDQSIQPAGGASKAGETAGQTAAPQEVTKLLLDKRRKPVAIPQRRGLAAEGLEVVSCWDVADEQDPVLRAETLRAKCRSSVIDSIPDSANLWVAPVWKRR